MFTAKRISFLFTVIATISLIAVPVASAATPAAHHESSELGLVGIIIFSVVGTAMLFGVVLMFQYIAKEIDKNTRF